MRQNKLTLTSRASKRCNEVEVGGASRLILSVEKIRVKLYSTLKTRIGLHGLGEYIMVPNIYRHATYHLEVYML